MMEDNIVLRIGEVYSGHC